MCARGRSVRESVRSSEHEDWRIDGSERGKHTNISIYIYPYQRTFVYTDLNISKKYIGECCIFFINYT